MTPRATNYAAGDDLGPRLPGRIPASIEQGGSIVPRLCDLRDAVRNVWDQVYAGVGIGLEKQCARHRRLAMALWEHAIEELQWHQDRHGPDWQFVVDALTTAKALAELWIDQDPWTREARSLAWGGSKFRRLKDIESGGHFDDESFWGSMKENERKRSASKQPKAKKRKAQDGST